uniref:Secreted protein n=1 Tax=Knipowitschia caucasica TaxID=637954 RepID=A0AAV2LVN2_KNICA
MPVPVLLCFTPVPVLLCFTPVPVLLSKPVRPKQLPVCSPTNPFYTYIRATEHNAYSNALFKTTPQTGTGTGTPNSVQANT